MEEFDLRKIFQVFYKRKNIIFVVVFTAVLFAAVFSTLSPKIYETQGTMLVFEHANEGTTRVPVAPNWYINTQMELMKSRGVISRVAKMILKKKISWGEEQEENSSHKGKKTEYSLEEEKLHLVGRNKLIGVIKGIIKSVKGGGTGSGDKLNGLIGEIKAHVSVSNKFGSNVFYMIVDSDDPKLAAAVSNAMMVEYKKENLTLKKEEISERIKKIEEDWKEAQFKWGRSVTFLNKYESVNSPLLKRDLNKERNDLTQKLRDLNTEKKNILIRLSPNSPEVKEKELQIQQKEKELKILDKDIQDQMNVANSLKKKQEAVNVMKVEYDKFDKKYKNLKAVLDDLVSDVQISEHALIPDSPIKPKVTVNIAIAGIASIMFAMALAFFLEFISRKIKNESDLEKSTESRVFCTLPVDTIKSYVGDVRNLPEQYRLMRTSLMASMGEGEKTILLTGTQKQNDNTPYVAANLALAFSLLEERQIILVDTDLRRPRCHEMFGMDITYGLVDYLIGALKDLNAKSTAQPNLKLITVGQIPPNPAELLESKRMKEVVQMLSQSSDIVIFCSSSLATYPDASVLATLTNKTLLTATVDETSIEDINRVKDILQHTKGKIMGSVLANII